MKTAVEVDKPVVKMETEFSGVPPPSSTTVDFDRKPVLYLPGGKVLVRKAGF